MGRQDYHSKTLARLRALSLQAYPGISVVTNTFKQARALPGSTAAVRFIVTTCFDLLCKKISRPKLVRPISIRATVLSPTMRPVDEL